ncbi:lipopolysaccharide core heptose(II) kinase RfaY [Sorangium sp. So ce429]
MELAYDRKIGRGAFADVWLAQDDIGQNVAVKFFNDTAPTQAEMNALNHAKALMRVESPKVVRVIALERQPHPDSGNDCLAIVMEYVPGPNLSLHEGPLSTEHAKSVIHDITLAVEAIHAAGLVHGDLHDGNVLITSTGAKIVDILYTHSLAEVGTKTAVRTRNDDIRALAVLMRQVVEKARRSGPDVAEVFYWASTVATSPKEMGDRFAGLLSASGSATTRVSRSERAQSVSRATPTPTRMRSIETSINKMTEADFAAILGSVDDSSDHHILWVSKSGDVHLSPVGDLTPAGWEEQHEAEIQFRWETFACGNGYCGSEAAKDTHYVASKLKELRADWASGRKGYLDF